MPDDDDILDDLFQSCAWAAYLDQAAARRGWPDSEATRRRAYDYYESELARRQRQRIIHAGDSTAALQSPLTAASAADADALAVIADTGEGS